MTHDETVTGDARTSEAGPAAGRRRFLRLSGSAVAVGLAGCSDLGPDDEPEDGAAVDEGAVGSTPADRATENGTEDARQPTSENGTEETDGPATETETGTGTEESDATQTEAAGDVHAHGSLSLEIDGEPHPFTDPKYYPPGEHPDAAATDRFHFHDDGHDDRWHMHGDRLTLATALGDLPDIDYESRDGVHVLHFEGETYQDGRGGTTVEIRQGETTVDTAEFELYDGDEIQVEVTTGEGGD